MPQTLRQIAAIWKRLGINQKVSLALVMLLVVAGIVLLVLLSRRQVYEVLYTDLEDKDMAKVASYLQDEKIPYQIANGGTAILVPRNRKYEIRLNVADKNLISNGHAGLELWSGPGWGASRTAEQMWKRRTIQGELARTIMHIEPVAWADVQVAQPEPSLFVADERPVTAAITLKLQSGRTLTPEQVAGIRRLVAGSVEALAVENVTVIDDRGNLLSPSRAADGTIQAAADVQQQQRAYEEYLMAKAQSMLDRVLGPGKAVVKVTATLDMQQVNETKTNYDPENTVARREKKTEKTTPTGTTAGANQKQSENEREYEVSQTVTTTRKVPGRVISLAVAVLLDPYYTDAEGKEQTRTDADVQELAESVKRAVGLQENTAERQDSFKVTKVRFQSAAASTVPDATVAAADKREFILSLAKYGSSVIAVLVFLVFARIMLKKMGGTALAGAAGQTTPAMALMAGGLALPAERDEETERLRARVRDMIAGNPEKTARILQMWLNEERKDSA